MVNILFKKLPMHVPGQGLEVSVLLIFASIFLLLIMLLLLLYTYHLFSDYLVGIVNISSK